MDSHSQQRADNYVRRVFKKPMPETTQTESALKDRLQAVATARERALKLFRRQ